jgi:hypothetical protein
LGLAPFITVLSDWLTLSFPSQKRIPQPVSNRAKCFIVQTRRDAPFCVFQILAARRGKLAKISFKSGNTVNPNPFFPVKKVHMNGAENAWIKFVNLASFS